MNSQQMVETPSFVRRFVRNIGLAFFVFPTLFMFLPWQQNVTANGQVTAFSPSERVQTVDAPVSGIITKWHVQEASKVKEGDLLLEISDTDTEFKTRLESQRDNQEIKLTSKKDELTAYEMQLKNLTSSRDAQIAATRYKLDVANQKRLSSSESVSAATATLEAATLQTTRLTRLLEDGLVSRRDVEVAERDEIIARRNLNSANAQLQSALAEVNSAKADINQIIADTDAKLASTRAVINKIKGELAETENSLTSAEINLSRQNMQRITAPRSGTIFQLPVNSQSQIIKQGDPLLVIVPDTAKRAVELWVDGRDAPLVYKGVEVRLEFEGWPAIQVPGWANVNVGTFIGEVAFVDPTDNGNGKFRVMVVHMPGSPKWPDAQFLRQGVMTKGWLLLQEVSIGYELWRILNSFPPKIPHHDSTYGIDRSKT